MLNNFKSFKHSRRLGLNLLNNPKFAKQALSFINTKRWEIFQKPARTTSGLLWTSKYFYGSKLALQQNYLAFFKRKEKQASFFQITKTLDSSLYIARFFKTIRHCRLAIQLGFVLVNGKTITKADFVLVEGDLVSVKADLLPPLLHYWKNSFFFSTYKDVKVFCQLPNCLEISYATGSFCFCFKQSLFGQLAQRKSISFTQKKLVVQVRYCLT
jgi:ribosomal protein S4